MQMPLGQAMITGVLRCQWAKQGIQIPLGKVMNTDAFGQTKCKHMPLGKAMQTDVPLGKAINTEAFGIKQRTLMPFGQSKEYRCLWSKQRIQMLLGQAMNTDTFGQSNDYRCLWAKQ